MMEIVQDIPTELEGGKACILEVRTHLNPIAAGEKRRERSWWPFYQW